MRRTCAQACVSVYTPSVNSIQPSPKLQCAGYNKQTPTFRRVFVLTSLHLRKEMVFLIVVFGVVSPLFCVCVPQCVKCKVQAEGMPSSHYLLGSSAPRRSCGTRRRRHLFDCWCRDRDMHYNHCHHYGGQWWLYIFRLILVRLEH